MQSKSKIFLCKIKSKLNHLLPLPSPPHPTPSTQNPFKLIQTSYFNDSFQIRLVHFVNTKKLLYFEKYTSLM
jgi:hypothetical protein